MTIRRYIHKLGSAPDAGEVVARIQMNTDNSIVASIDQDTLFESKAVFQMDRLEDNVAKALVALMQRDNRVPGDLSKWELLTLCVTDGGEQN